jgi:carbonic anhydrase/acetyltransferase-like protein (isoleucine patch superfamily)
MPIYALGDIEPNIDPLAFVHPDAVVIGAVHIGAEASVWPSAVLRGDAGEIRIGARTSTQDGSVLHTTASHPTVVGDGCVVGHLVHLEGCTLQDGSLVGNGAIVLHGAVVETGSLVGSNAVVTNGMVVPAGSMALGVPAKLRPAGTAALADIDRTVDTYAARAARYRVELRRVG